MLLGVPPATHLHTTNPIESTFATVRHRTKVTKGPARGPDSPWRYAVVDELPPDRNELDDFLVSQDNRPHTKITTELADT
ncbi:hypothetical protein [Amycolatopsis sp. lyj-108]|uniref:hypothetical protein n=1 Tax=Amycolatopsis sp. lyj-108 TaxID=2789286 RepID=UPI00397DBB72